MDEALLQRITEKVLQRLNDKPKAFCIGTPPEDFPFQPVDKPPYEAVVLCTLTPAQLLSMPDDTVCRALLEGLPVYLCEEGLEHRKFSKTSAKSLYSLLLSKERQLKNLGVQSLMKAETGKLLTAQDIRKIKADGGKLPIGARLTPLARDIWEGKP